MNIDKIKEQISKIDKLDRNKLALIHSNSFSTVIIFSYQLENKTKIF